MTRMLPPTIHPDVRSGGERRLFGLLQGAPQSDHWVCLHSLGLARHAYKRRAEIDFLLITRKGVFILEVKSGRVARREGEWILTDRYGTKHKASESPFDQASSAMFALERDIRRHFHDDPRLPHLLFGYGVVFPDIEFDMAGCEADRGLVCDIRDMSRPITAYVDTLARFTQSSQSRARLAPSGEDIERLVDFLRGDFDAVPTLAARAGTTSHELLQLTREQYAVLDSLTVWPRCVIQGSAGTGKTVLAVEAARRATREGRRVLLLCYNRFLATHLRDSLHAEGLSDCLVGTVYQHLDRLIRASSWEQEFDERRGTADTATLYQVLYPEYAAMAAIDQPSAFDMLIVDEAQDVMTDQVLDVFDVVLDGSLAHGQWRFFLDANNQAAVYGRLDPNAMARLLRYGCSTVLTLNCRNSKQVASETEMLTRPKCAALSRIEGCAVRYGWYVKVEEQEKKLARVLDALVADGAEPGSISVLSPRTPEESCAHRLAARGEFRLEPLSEAIVGALMSRAHPRVTYASISAFKGLENDFIVITDLEDLDSAWWQSVTYVGMSRARVGLSLLLPESLRVDYESALRNWLRAHSMLQPEEKGLERTDGAPS